MLSHRTFKSWSERYGGLMLIYLGTKPALVVSSAKVAKEIMKTHDAVISNRGNNRDSDNENEAKNFVDVLLEVQKENSAGFPLERDSIKALIVDAFAAGTDTTYTVLEWAMTELIRNPRVMEEVQKEVREIGGNKDHITEDDLSKMKYLKAVISETLRMYPPNPLLVPRESTQNLKINGYDISSGTLVFINAWAVQRDSATWAEPEEFRPERFLNSSIDLKRQDFEFIPFGGGRRMCPGISFSAAINVLVLANIVHKFDWALPAGVNVETLDMSECAGLTIHRNTPLLVVPTLHVK